MASLAVSVQGLRAPALLSSGNALQGMALSDKVLMTARAVPRVGEMIVRAATENIPGGGPRSVPKKRSGTKFATQPLTGTKFTRAKKLKVLEPGDTKLRDKAKGGETAAIKLLSRVEQLRLLSKAEKAGLLSAAESAGFSLSSIEKFGLLSKAEEFGALSAAVDPKTPSLLLVAALSLLVIGPAFVYFVPEDSTPLVVIQVVVAVVSVLGGSAAFAASSFVSALQSSD